MPVTKEAPAPATEELERIPVCSDLDEDCPTVPDHLACWLYDLGKGRCPWCRA